MVITVVKMMDGNRGEGNPNANCGSTAQLQRGHLRRPFLTTDASVQPYGEQTLSFILSKKKGGGASQSPKYALTVTPNLSTEHVLKEASGLHHLYPGLNYLQFRKLQRHASVSIRPSEGWAASRHSSSATNWLGSAVSALPMMPLFSFINMQKYLLKLASFLATVLVKRNTFHGESKRSSLLKMTAEVFFFHYPSPMNIKPLFLEKKE